MAGNRPADRFAVKTPATVTADIDGTCLRANVLAPLTMITVFSQPPRLRK